MGLFDFGRKTVSASEWVTNKINELNSLPWDEWREKKLNLLKNDCVSQPIDNDAIKNILLAVQLNLFSAICVHSQFRMGTSEELGVEAIAQIDSLLMDPSTDKWLIAGYKESSQYAMQYSSQLVNSKPIPIDEACLLYVANLLQIKENSAFITELRDGLFNFRRQLIEQIRQLRFT